MLKKTPISVKIIFLLTIINSLFILIYNSFNLYTNNRAFANATEIAKGEQIFKANCSGCHKSGKNLIKKEKPIIGSAKLQSKETLKVFISNPIPPMPNFKNITTDEEKLDALYKYLTSLK